MLKRLDKIRFRGPRTRDDFPDLAESPPASDNECSDDMQLKPRGTEDLLRDPVSAHHAYLLNRYVCICVFGVDFSLIYGHIFSWSHFTEEPESDFFFTFYCFFCFLFLFFFHFAWIVSFFFFFLFPLNIPLSLCIIFIMVILFVPYIRIQPRLGHMATFLQCTHELFCLKKMLWPQCNT